MLSASNSVDSVVVAICALGFLAFLSSTIFLLYFASRRHDLHLEWLHETSKRKGGKQRCKWPKREDQRVAPNESAASAVERLDKFIQLGSKGLRPKTMEAAQQTLGTFPEDVLEERERLAMKLEEARQGTKVAEAKVAHLLAELSQNADNIQQLYSRLYASQNVERENAALKEELKRLREAMTDVRVLSQLSQHVEDMRQLYAQMCASQDAERENLALKEELQTLREAMPDVEQMQIELHELKKFRGQKINMVLVMTLDFSNMFNLNGVV